MLDEPSNIESIIQFVRLYMNILIKCN